MKEKSAKIYLQKKFDKAWQKKEKQMERVDRTEQAFAENLRRRRRELGLTQKQLAEALCYSEKAVSKWESGRGMPPASVLPLLADRLQIDIDSLLTNRFTLDQIKEALVDSCSGALKDVVYIGCPIPEDLAHRP